MATKSINVKSEDIEIDKNGRVIIKNKKLADEIKRLTPEEAAKGLNFWCDEKCH